MKDGLKLQQSGMDVDAVKAFQASLAKNMTNTVSREGLANAGRQVMNYKLDEFSRNAMMNRSKDAVYAFMDIKQFKLEVKKYGVDLNIADQYFRDYAVHEESYLSIRYEEGIAQLGEDDFPGAKAVFDEILYIHPGYKDVQSLQGTSVLEPKYRRALEEMQNGDYRRAYFVFEEILKKSAYKESSANKKECLKKGSFVLAIPPFEDYRHNGAGAKLQAYSLDAMVGLQNPFLRIVDRQNLNEILAEQNFSLSGMIDENTAVEVGNLIGAQAILMGRLIDHREESGSLTRVQMRGYESYSIKERGEDGNEKESIRYKPVMYNQYYDQNKVYLNFHLKLVSLETGEILLTRIMEKEVFDIVDFVSYQGNVSNLFPEIDGRADLSKGTVNLLRSKCKARSELMSMIDISRQAFGELGQDMAHEIQDFLNR